MQKIKRIDFGGVNGYLVSSGDGFILIDTGISTKRVRLDQELDAAGCKPGDLKLVILTHGDVDHAGNGPYLRQKHAARLAMHAGDAGMVARGDMAWNRKARADRTSTLGVIIMFMSKIMQFFSQPVRFETFKPDIYLEDGQDLSEYGLDAQILHLPGHSKGSIGILSASGGLFCGDLLMNMIRPEAHFLIDDLADFRASLARLRSLNIQTVYPGHGKPFPLVKLSSCFEEE